MDGIASSNKDAASEVASGDHDDRHAEVCGAEELLDAVRPHVTLAVKGHLLLLTCLGCVRERCKTQL